MEACGPVHLAQRRIMDRYGLINTVVASSPQFIKALFVVAHVM